MGECCRCKHKMTNRNKRYFHTVKGKLKCKSLKACDTRHGKYFGRRWDGGLSRGVVGGSLEAARTFNTHAAFANKQVEDHEKGAHDSIMYPWTTCPKCNKEARERKEKERLAYAPLAERIQAAHSQPVETIAPL